MAIVELKGPDSDSKLPSTNSETAETGWSYKKMLANLNTMLVELYAAAVTAPASQSAIQFVDVTISSAELLALNGTPKTILAAPGVGFANLVDGVVAYKAAGTAYAGIAAGEDLSIKYTNSSGLEVLEIETTGFLDQATAQTRYASSFRAASGISSITPVENAAFIMMLLSGEITTGTSPLKLRIYYRTIPITF